MRTIHYMLHTTCQHVVRDAPQRIHRPRCASSYLQIASRQLQFAFRPRDAPQCSLQARCASSYLQIASRDLQFAFRPRDAPQRIHRPRAREASKPLKRASTGPFAETTPGTNTARPQPEGRRRRHDRTQRIHRPRAREASRALQRASTADGQRGRHDPTQRVHSPRAGDAATLERSRGAS